MKKYLMNNCLSNIDMKKVIVAHIIILACILKSENILCQDLFFNAGIGISSFHAQKITSPFYPKLNYSLGLSFEGESTVSGHVGINLENKGGKNKYNNWKIDLHYLTVSIGVKYNPRNMLSASFGGYTSVIVSKNITSNDAIQSSDVYTFWNKYDAGAWLEVIRKIKLSFNVHNDKTTTMNVFFKGQYGFVNTIERWNGLLTSQGDWIRNANFQIGVKFKVP
jgi:hypothetical protein